MQFANEYSIHLYIIMIKINKKGKNVLTFL